MTETQAIVELKRIEDYMEENFPVTKWMIFKIGNVLSGFTEN